MPATVRGPTIVVPRLHGTHLRAVRSATDVEYEKEPILDADLK